MKKIVLLFVVAMLVFAFVACSSGELIQAEAKIITKAQAEALAQEIEDDAFKSSWKGSLNASGPETSLTEFSLVMSGMLVSEIDSSSIGTAVNLLARNDLSLLDSRTYAQCVDLVVAIENFSKLLNGSKLTINEAESLAKSLVCNGQTRTYGEWSLSVETNDSAKTITIKAKRK